MNHPNAAVAGSTSTVGVIVVWLLGRFHIAVSAEEGAAIAGGASAIALFIGRNGVKGVWYRLMHGGSAAPAK